MVNWTNETDPVSIHFTVKEALWLPTWSRMATESDGLTDDITNNLIKIFNKMDKVRDFFGKPIIVHVAFRSVAYNKLIGGAPNSSHCQGLAVDFNVDGIDCDTAKQMILNQNVLDLMNLRMENNGTGANWVHLASDWQPGHNRYFLP